MPDTFQFPLGVTTWLWNSPLTDDALATIAPRVAEWGFDVIELPVENAGDWNPETAAKLLADLGLSATVGLVMGDDRNLVATDAATVAHTQDYLRRVLDAAATVGSPSIAGPAYASVGRTWQMDGPTRSAHLRELADNLGPVVEHGLSVGVRLAVEPLNRYETSLINTVEQALEAVAPLPAEGAGVLLDTYHMNIEEKDLPAAIRSAAGRIAHVQVCGNDRGAPGNDHLDWRSILDALDEAGYRGPLCIESFTGGNATIATAASIWRPLERSQDAIATDGLSHLKAVMRQR